MNQYNNQGKDHKVAATQETTAQNAEIQSYFNGFGRYDLYEIGKALSTTYSRPGGLQFNPSYFQNYLEMTNKFIQGARMGEDKKNMVLNAFHFVCDALLEANEPGILETPTGLTTGKRMKDRVKDLESALNEWTYVDADTLDYERGPHTELEDWERDKEKIRQLAKKCADELLEDVEGMIKVISEVYGI